MTGTEDISQQLTPWYSGDLKPVRPGPYKRGFPAGPYSCWDGKQWFGDASTAARAAISETPSAHQRADWRGLVTPSEAPCSTCHGHGVLDHGEDDEEGWPSLAPCPDC